MLILQKFPGSIKDSIGILPEQPSGLKNILNSQEKYVNLDNNLNLVKDYIIENLT